MNCGSYDYVCHIISDFAKEMNANTSLRKDLQNHLMLVSKAIHDIELNDALENTVDESISIRSALQNCPKQTKSLWTQILRGKR